MSKSLVFAVERRATAALAALLLSALAVTGCAQTAAVETRPVLRLTGNSALSEALASELKRVFTGADIQVVDGNIETIQEGRADFGLALADWARFEHGSAPAGSLHASDQIRGIAVLQIAPLHLLVSPQSGIKHITDLRGKRVRIGTPRNTGGTGTLPFAGAGVLAESVLTAFGISLRDVQAEALSTTESFQRLKNGTLDALFITPFYPLPSISDAIHGGARLLPIEGPVIAKLRREYPFLRLAAIQPQTYAGETEVVHTVGVDGLLVCRKGLEEALAYELTKHFFSALRRLASANAYLRTIELARAAATPIPLHPGAARYYRESELFPR